MHELQFMLFDSSSFDIDQCRIIIDDIHKTLNFYNRIQSSQNKYFITDIVRDSPGIPSRTTT